MFAPSRSFERARFSSPSLTVFSCPALFLSARGLNVYAPRLHFRCISWRMWSRMAWGFQLDWCFIGGCCVVLFAPCLYFADRFLNFNAFARSLLAPLAGRAAFSSGFHRRISAESNQRSASSGAAFCKCVVNLVQVLGRSTGVHFFCENRRT